MTLIKMCKNKTVGSALLLAGTQIGAGMLALPLTTGVVGFFYAALLFVICFLFMFISLLYLMEASLMASKANANLFSIVKERLGTPGKLVAWLSFLALLYAVAAAYLSGGGSLIAEVCSLLLKTQVSASIGIALFLILFGSIVVFGMRAVELINRLFMVLLSGSFVALLVSVIPLIRWKNFGQGKVEYIWAAIPVVILSFTSHIILPGIKNYLGGNVGKMKRCLFWGSLIPLLFYLIWELLIIGVLPIGGEYGLETIGSNPNPVAGLTEALHHFLGVSWVAPLVGLFSFFALVTSFFGVALSLYDFFEDLIHVEKRAGGRFLLAALIFIPPLLFAFFFPKGFILALGYAGVFVAVLYGILPVCAVWKGRYIEKKRVQFKVFGGKFLMLLMVIGSCLIIYFQIAATRGWLPSLG